MKHSLPDAMIESTLANEVSSHYPIQFSNLQNIKLFFINMFKWCITYNSKNRKLKKLYKQGKQKIETNLNIDNIMNTLRDCKMVVKTQMIDATKRFKF